MSTKTLLSAVAVAAVLGGCAPVTFVKPPPVGPGTPRCGTGQPCVIKVNVSCLLLICKASVDHPLVVISRGSSNVPIRWELQHPNYKFATNGIEFVDDKDGEFKCGALGQDRFQCVDRNSKSATTFKYIVNLIGSPSVPPLDPFVRND